MMFEQFDQKKIDKAGTLKRAGINPYDNKFERTSTIKGLSDVAEGTRNLAGRVLEFNKVNSVITIEDVTGRLDIGMEDSLDVQSRLVLENVDRGDFIGCVVLRKATAPKPEYRCTRLCMLTKALLDFPHEHELASLSNRRSLPGVAVAVDPRSCEVLKTRIRFIENIRKYLHDEGMVELETPILKSWYDIVCFPQFETKGPNGTKLFLRLCHEDRLKLFVAGGFEKVFELGKSFRPGEDNDSPKHLQEFLQLETIQAFTTYRDMMNHVETLFSKVTEWTIGKPQLILSDERTIDITPPWRKISVRDAIKQYTGVDILKYSTPTDGDPKTDPDGLKNEVLQKLSNDQHRNDPHSRVSRSAGPPADLGASNDLLPRKPYDKWYWSIVEHLIGTFVQPNLLEPTILFDYPLESNWLIRRIDDRPDFGERFEFYIDRTEMGNCYSLVNDPVDFAQRVELGIRSYCVEFASQWQAEPRVDNVLMLAKAYGLPPFSESSIGIERWLTKIVGASEIAGVVWIPFRDA